jgi:hypothetical protein
MQNLYIEGTNSTPAVLFETNGTLTLKGRSLILDVVSFYQPLIDWIAQLNVPSVKFSVDFDYFNSASSKMILDMLKILDANNNIKDFHVYWYFESDDEDILEVGQIFEEKLFKATFIYKEYAEAS